MKKTLSVFLCFLLLFSFSLNTAYGLSVVESAGEYLKDIGLYTGYEDGSLGLDRNITRAEFATLAVRIEGLEDLQEDNKGNTAFKDVSSEHWASGFINIATGQDLIVGFEDNTYRPEENVTYVQTLAVIIRILGYDNNLEGEWPNNYINKAKELGLSKNINLDPDDVINRGEIAVIVKNALSVDVQ